MLAMLMWFVVLTRSGYEMGPVAFVASIGPILFVLVYFIVLLVRMLRLSRARLKAAPGTEAGQRARMAVLGIYFGAAAALLGTLLGFGGEVRVLEASSDILYTVASTASVSLLALRSRASDDAIPRFALVCLLVSSLSESLATRVGDEIVSINGTRVARLSESERREWVGPTHPLYDPRRCSQSSSFCVLRWRSLSLSYRPTYPSRRSAMLARETRRGS